MLLQFLLSHSAVSQIFQEKSFQEFNPYILLLTKFQKHHFERKYLINLKKRPI